jgi:hypothetical protein
MSERPPNCPVYTGDIVVRALQSVYTLNYFIQGLLLHGDMCPLLLWPLSDDVTWAFGP